MPPRAHVSHYHQPARSLLPEIPDRFVIGDRRNSIGKKPHLVPLFSDKSANQQTISWTILDRLVAAELFQARAAGCNRCTQRKCDSVELFSHENAWVEIRHHADVLQAVNKTIFLNRKIQASDSSDLGIGKGSYHIAQVIWTYAHVAVANHDNVMLCFRYQPIQFFNFVVRSAAGGPYQNAHRAFGEIVSQFF